MARMNDIRRELTTLQFAVWLVAGTVAALCVQACFVYTSGEANWASLLHVGSESPPRKTLVEQLGPIPDRDRTGHDGQLFYLIARDPFNRHHTDAILAYDNPSYRYRRILFPLLAGGFGQFGPRATLWGMILLSAVGFGLAAAATVELCSRWQLPRVTALAASFNLGLMMSLIILVCDALALGLSLLAVALWYRGYAKTTYLLLALAVLTKEYYALFAIALALASWAQRRRLRAVALAVLPALPMLAWLAFVRHAVPGGDNSMERFSLPLAGIAQSIPYWLRTDADFVVFGVFALGLTAAAGLLLFRVRDPFLRWSCLLWSLMGLFASMLVWGPSNNILRCLAPLWTLVLLGASRAVRVSRTRAESDLSNDLQDSQARRRDEPRRRRNDRRGSRH